VTLGRNGDRRRCGGLRSAALLCAALLLVAACARGETWTHGHGASNPLVGSIRDLATGRAIGEAELVERLGAQDFVLVGEAPGNADHARLSARLVRSLAAEGRRLAAVAIEQLPTDAQPLIVEYLAGHPGDARGLDRAIRAAAPDRPQLAQFTPALAAAVASGSQIVAADLSADTLRAVLTHGFKALQPDLVRRTGLAEPFATPVEEGLRAELAAASCERANGRALEALARARRARDATMADRLAAVTGRGQSLLLAAGSHVRTDRGVPWYLRQLRPGARIASLALVELPDAAAAAPGPGELPYDYVWFTPAARPAGFDRCEALRLRARERGGAGEEMDEQEPPPAPRPKVRLPVAYQAGPVPGRD
jgi:uncharacterized iron-regulated protein